MDNIILADPDFNIRLYNLSLIKTSISFWEQSEIKTEIQNYVVNNFPSGWNSKDWHKITQKVLYFADTYNLPPTTLPELKDAIVNVGVKIYNWIMYVYWDLGLDVSRSFPIVWTPLGFVDEDKIFKSIWVKDELLYLGYPDKPIFRLACLLAQEDFVEKHQCEMIDDLKKLPMLANRNNIELEVVNSSDKTYGIISTYVSYYVFNEWANFEYYYHSSSSYHSKDYFETRENKMYVIYDGENILYESNAMAVNRGSVLPPEIMVKLSAWPGLFHAVKYYFERLNSSQKKDVGRWLMDYFDMRCNKLDYKNIFNNCRLWKFQETLAFITSDSKNHGSEGIDFMNPQRKFFKYIYLCPLEDVLWPIVRKCVNMENAGKGFLNIIFSFMTMDYHSGIPMIRNFFQKLVKNTLVACSGREVQRNLNVFIDFCEIRLQDFTMLKTLVFDHECDIAVFVQKHLRLLFRRLKYPLHPPCMPEFEGFKKFFDQLFDSPEDRVSFFLEEFCRSHLLMEGNFDTWEHLYHALNFLQTPLKHSIDPVTCLRWLICWGVNNLEKCDEFIKWWQEAEEDQSNLKEEFKVSPYLSECIYEFWTDIFHVIYGNEKDRSVKLLKWLFDSEHSITQFKREKLSIFGLLNASFNDSSPGFGIFYANEVHEVIDEFIKFCEVAPESISIVKHQISCNIEEIILNHAIFPNIATLDFLMDWVSISEENKKNIFQKLIDSSKMLKLCQDVTRKYYSNTCIDIFYHKWLKYCANIPQLKRELISAFKAFRSDQFILRLSLMCEKLERGEMLEDTDKFCDF